MTDTGLAVLLAAYAVGLVAACEASEGRRVPFISATWNALCRPFDRAVASAYRAMRRWRV
jgi:hypothetical protein